MDIVVGGCGNLATGREDLDSVDNRADIPTGESTAVGRGASWIDGLINAFHGPYYYCCYTDIYVRYI